MHNYALFNEFKDFYFLFGISGYNSVSVFFYLFGPVSRIPKNLIRSNTAKDLILHSSSFNRNSQNLFFKTLYFMLKYTLFFNQF